MNASKVIWCSPSETGRLSYSRDKVHLLGAWCPPRQTRDPRRVMDGSLIDVLAGVPLFGPLARGTLEALAIAANPRHIAAGDFVLRAGDAGDALFVVQSGGFEVLVNGRRT